MIREEKQDVDRGYAWVVLLGCFVMYFFVVGTLKSYGILYTEIDEHYNVGSGPVAFISSIFFACLFGLAPIANYVAVKTSFRSTAFVGGMLLGFGYAASCFVKKLEYLFLTLGLVAGLGYGISFAPCSTIISFYFEKRRALANGITVSASGIGAIVLSFLYRYLIKEYTLKPAMLILGGIFLNLCVAACCFRQPKALSNKKQIEWEVIEDNVTVLADGDDTFGTETMAGKRCSSRGPDFRFSLFKTPRFTLYAIAFVLAASAYSNNYILIPSHAKSIGIDKNGVALTVSVMGFCEIGARILMGWIVDKHWVKTKHIFSICFLISSIFAFITPLFRNLEYMCIYAAIVGIFPASFWSLVSVLIIEVVGIKDFPPAFGLVLLGLAIGSIVCQPSAAWLKDQTGNWNASFYLTGILLLIPVILMLIEPLIISTEENNKEQLAKLENHEKEYDNTKIPKNSEKEDDSLLSVSVNGRR